MDIEKYQKQHMEILDEIQILRKLIADGLDTKAEEVCEALIRMNFKVKVHLASEDKFVYPRLLKSADPNTSSQAASFQSEMGDIAKVYNRFSRKWYKAEHIAADPALFQDQANSIFTALHNRIRQEEKNLYPLAAAC